MYYCMRDLFICSLIYQFIINSSLFTVHFNVMEHPEVLSLEEKVWSSSVTWSITSHIFFLSLTKLRDSKMRCEGKNIYIYIATIRQINTGINSFDGKLTDFYKAQTVNCANKTCSSTVKVLVIELLQEQNI